MASVRNGLIACDLKKNIVGEKTNHGLSKLRLGPDNYPDGAESLPSALVVKSAFVHLVSKRFSNTDTNAQP